MDRSMHGMQLSPAGAVMSSSSVTGAPLWHEAPFDDDYACTCPFEHGGAFCDEPDRYREFDEAEVFPPEIYNITLRTSIDADGSIFYIT